MLKTLRIITIIGSRLLSRPGSVRQVGTPLFREGTEAKFVITVLLGARMTAEVRGDVVGVNLDRRAAVTAPLAFPQKRRVTPITAST